ncbi:MAG: 4Fe-4S dicluster domain-containing protein [Syntrophobacteraceae bacterium]|nr:4Fe-4S dicluster domain-containing protein [Desulfobacteraceae bacterium]
MNTINLSNRYDGDFVRGVEEESGQKVSLCYQCGNCTAGCPFSFAYDFPVNQVMRLVQAGQKDTVLGCKSIWLCGTCESCTTRCPNNIDVARVMDVLRHMARREGRVAEPQIKQFWDTFLSSVQAHGRVFEVGLLAGFITKTGRFWTDVDLGPLIAPKGKLSLRPHNIKGKAEVERIFERFLKGEAS